MGKKRDQDISNVGGGEFYNPNGDFSQNIANVGNLGVELNNGSEAVNDVSALAQTQNQFIDPDVSPQQSIAEQTLSGVDRSNAPSNIDDAIERSIFDKLGNGVQNTKDAPLIQQGNSLFRGANDNILKGNVSGSVIGNQPIFVAGGDTMAYDVLNNRQKAIQDAATLKQQETAAFLSKGPPKLKEPRLQRNFNNRFNETKENYIKQAEEEFGADWGEALKDQTNPLGRAFVQDMANYDFVAGQLDQVTDFITEIDKGLASGNSMYSEETLQLRDDYDTLQGAFLNGDISGAIDLSSEFNKLKGSATLDNILNDQGIKIESGITNQYASIVEGSDEYTTTTQKKVVYEDQLRIIANGLAKSQMRDAVRKGLITEEEIFERLNARYGYENIIDKKVTNKSGSGGGKFTINLDSDFGEPKEEVIGGASYEVYDAIEIPTDVKPISASGLKVLNPDGSYSFVDGVRDVDLNSFQIVNSPVEGRPGEFEKRQVVVGTHTERTKGTTANPKGNEVEVTAIYDMEDMGSRVKTDLVKSPEQLENFNKMKKRFDGQTGQTVETATIEKKSR